MKRPTLKAFTAFAIAGLMFAGTACKKENNDPEVVNDEEMAYEILEGDIKEEKSLDASKTYLLRGKVYVQDGGKIVIPAGTVIKGEKSTDGTLVINRGGKIDARGTASNPIVFTSQAEPGFRNRGDWGGIVILGKSHTNAGANVPIEGIIADANSENGVYGPGSGSAILDDNSGVMTYCRIEFAGIDLSQDNELNSLTMGAVGDKTEINHIMVTYANDDAYEWFGGTVNHKYLVAYSTLDDDFDTDKGYSGKVQFALVIRDKSTADISTARAFEASSSSSANTPHSAPKFANVTVVGPRTFAKKSDGKYGDYNSLFGAAVEINSNSNLEVHNSIIAGFPTGVRWNSAGADNKVQNCVFTDHETYTALSGNNSDNGIPASFTDNEEVSDRADIFGANATYDVRTPSPILQATNSPYKTGAPSLNDSFFENVDFYGAFGSEPHAGWDWNAGWVNFDPINTTY